MKRHQTRMLFFFAQGPGGAGGPGAVGANSTAAGGGGGGTGAQVAALLPSFMVAARLVAHVPDSAATTTGLLLRSAPAQASPQMAYTYCANGGTGGAASGATPGTAGNAGAAPAASTSYGLYGGIVNPLAGTAGAAGGANATYPTTGNQSVPGAGGAALGASGSAGAAGGATRAGDTGAGAAAGASAGFLSPQAVRNSARALSAMTEEVFFMVVDRKWRMKESRGYAPWMQPLPSPKQKICSSHGGSRGGRTTNHSALAKRMLSYPHCVSHNVIGMAGLPSRQCGGRA